MAKTLQLKTDQMWYSGCDRTVTADISVTGSTASYTISSVCTSSSQAYTSVELQYSRDNSNWSRICYD